LLGEVEVEKAGYPLDLDADSTGRVTEQNNQGGSALLASENPSYVNTMTPSNAFVFDHNRSPIKGSPS
jgi:hypothetical protein